MYKTKMDQNVTKNTEQNCRICMQSTKTHQNRTFVQGIKMVVITSVNSISLNSNNLSYDKTHL